MSGLFLGTIALLAFDALRRAGFGEKSPTLLDTIYTAPYEVKRAPFFFALAYTIAIGIGLHSFGEGSSIGLSLVADEGALSTLLMIGIASHKIFEGLSVVMPIFLLKPSLRTIIFLGAIAGIPGLVGIFFGSWFYSAHLYISFLGITSGVIFFVGSKLLMLGYKKEWKNSIILSILLGFVLLYLLDIMIEHPILL
ncbi:MAG: hypothetical protein ACUVTD_07470 [Nitrososphaerales archaeon]